MLLFNYKHANWEEICVSVEETIESIHLPANSNISKCELEGAAIKSATSKYYSAHSSSLSYLTNIPKSLQPLLKEKKARKETSSFTF